MKMLSKLFEKKEVSKRVRGAELVLIGTALFFSKFVIGTLAPLAISAWGAYRWLVRKSYKEGVVLVATGVLLLFLLKWSPLAFLLYVPMIAGIGVLIWGAVLMIMGKKKED